MVASMQNCRRSKGLCALAAFSVLAALGIGAPPDASAAPNYPNLPQIIQFNIYGGNGNATTGYNTTVAPAIVSSVQSRSGSPIGLSLNEVCENQYNYIVWYLTAAGYGYSFDHTVSLGNFLGSQVGTTWPIASCGSWYGNAVAVKGARSGGGANWYSSSIQGPSSYGEQRNWICIRASGPTICSSHLATGASSYTASQADVYRSVANFVAGSGVFAAGDFNTTPSVTTLAWALGGFAEADAANNFPTFQSGATNQKLDYIWRKNFGGYPYDAYIYNSPHSDHHWYQGYV